MFEHRWLPAGHHFPQRHLQRLTPAVVAAGLEMEHLAAIAEPTLRSSPQMGYGQRLVSTYLPTWTCLRNASGLGMGPC